MTLWSKGLKSTSWIECSVFEECPKIPRCLVEKCNLCVEICPLSSLTNRFVFKFPAIGWGTLEEKWSNFDLKCWVIRWTKNWLSISGQFNSNILKLLGIPGQILVPPVTQLFRSKWPHFYPVKSPLLSVSWPASPLQQHYRCSQAAELFWD